MDGSDDTESDEPSDQHPRLSVFPSGPRALAWVLEDSRQQALAIQEALQSLLDVRLFHDSPQLLEALTTEQPDVLLLDWHVPEISGLEVLAVVRQNHDEVTLPVLMLTAAQGGRGAIEALAVGANDYASKPFLPSELRARVSTLVRIRSLHARARRAERDLAEAVDRETKARTDAQREREKLYSVFVHAPVAMAVLEGPRHVFSFANTAYRTLVNGRDVVGKPLLEALPDIAGMGFDTTLDAVMATGEPITVAEMPIRMAHHRGDEAPILSFTYTAKTNELGERDGVVMFGWDVTELVRARQRMKVLSEQKEKSEAQLRLMTDTMPLLVSFVTADETYGFANKAYEEWFGISSRDLIGRKVRDVIGEAAYSVLGPYVKRGLSGERFSFEQHGVPYRTGGERDVRVTFVPLALGQDERGGYLALLEDITVQRMLEAERETLARERSQALERQSQFEQQLIGIVSHDLRTPLNVITLSAALVARAEGLSTSILKNVARIQSSAERAVRMVADLLDFTQARLGEGIRIQRRPTNVQSLIQALLVELEATSAGRQIQYTHSGDGQGNWDAERLTQLAQNLVTNALKYSPMDSVVTITTQAEAGSLQMRVHNVGAAIPADKRSLLFEPLQRGVAEIDRVTRSVGLGLYIVQKIAEAHGGTVHVESTEALGTTFTVVLPTAAPAVAS